MKLLDWMQHKFRQTNNEPPTAFAPRKSCSCLPGQPQLDDLQYYPKSHYNAKTSSKTQTARRFRKSFTCLESAKQTEATEEDEKEPADDVFSELFHGFLAIGTLASETVTNEPKTPTFGTFVENNMENETEAKEIEFKLVNDELEKVLEPERKENEAVVCPLQDYLFSSVVEASETATVKKEKEHRTSLGELFQKTKTVEQLTGGKINKTEKAEKTAVCLMKKILKGRTLHSSSNKPATTDKKPHKILQMFHRKVHPEGHVVEPKSEKHMKNVTHGNFVGEYKNKKKMLFEDAKLCPTVDTYKKGANCTMSCMSSGCCMSDSDGNKECWIKSDAEYLVLEL